MDYIKKARGHIDMADAFKPYQEGPERAAIESSIAIGYALIALVERLDKVIATDCEGKTGSISVDTGL